MKNNKRCRRIFVVEQLEPRCLLSGFDSMDVSDFHPIIVAGDPIGTPSDSPTIRVDPNVTTSPFAGVGSLQINTKRGTYICTGTLIDPTHVLTAGHCLDLNNDGKSNSRDGIRSVTFILNYPSTSATTIGAKSWIVNPDFTGFNRPSVNDDLTVITLVSAPVLPSGMVPYSLATEDMKAGTTHLYMVGYGQSGYGTNSSYTVNASFTVKRHGENILDGFVSPGQDDANPSTSLGTNESYLFDFDAPSTFNQPGGSLGNNIETTLGGGDSGGPSFVLLPGQDPASASSYRLVGVNTFTYGSAPKFGSGGGGINVFPYEAWIQSVIQGTPPLSVSSGGGGNAGSGGGGTAQGGLLDAEESLAFIAPPTDVVAPPSNVGFVWNSTFASWATASIPTVAVSQSTAAPNSSLTSLKLASASRSELVGLVTSSPTSSGGERAVQRSRDNQLKPVDKAIGDDSDAFDLQILDGIFQELEA